MDIEDWIGWGYVNEVEWRLLDRARAREEIRRFVERAQRGDLTSPPLLHEAVEEEETVKEWDMEKIREAGQVIGVAPNAESSDQSPPPSCSTAPTVRLVARHQPANASGASSTGRSTVTTTRSDWERDSRIPPKSNEAVAKLMAEKGVNRRRAYAMLRAQKSAEIDTSNVVQGQRIAVLTCLITHPEAGRDAPILLEALHGAGIRIDMHDTVKTLWALQKTDYVSFRERGGRSLYAIKVTDAGLAWIVSLKPKGDDNELLPDPVAATVEEVPEEALRVFRNAQAFQKEIDELGAGKPLLPPLPSGYTGPDWPQLTALRQRAAKAEKINQAAKLLEEAGIEDVAIDLMDRTKFNSLEEEVIRLLRTLGEIE
jgi:hypothetical protein